ncbi:N-acetylmuramoyl-L-alanine amidase CwlD [Bacillus marinisedimentorum]|uniref:N-acetylmuramoyl-L-alanine amidase CwlD n=1 Tax=Bacillus marinisedimentorum TaxID=1821260 RepID=UPI0007E1E9DC|nr:N-acetylmuramoyl-L-alanine amidase CwlD [Bacillus marinisedimentorum]
MKKRLKMMYSFFGIAVLLFIFQYEFVTENSWNTWNLPLTGKVIVIDPGHGGPDGGAVGQGDVLEKDIALAVSHELRDYLQEAGALVKMTREIDTDLAGENVSGYSRRKTADLKNRVKVVNESNADLFVSVHLNAIPSSRWRGAQTFFHPSIEESERAARFIQAELKRNLNNTNRYAKAINGIYVLKQADIPGALVEVGFLSNPEERQLLQDKAYQNKLAASIYEGLLRYYTDEETLEK